MVNLAATFFRQSVYCVYTGLLPLLRVHLSHPALPSRSARRVFYVCCTYTRTPPRRNPKRRYSPFPVCLLPTEFRVRAALELTNVFKYVFFRPVPRGRDSGFIPNATSLNVVGVYVKKKLADSPVSVVWICRLFDATQSNRFALSADISLRIFPNNFHRYKHNNPFRTTYTS